MPEINDEHIEVICQNTQVMQMDFGQMKADLEVIKSELQSKISVIDTNLVRLNTALQQIADVRERLGCDEEPNY